MENERRVGRKEKKEGGDYRRLLSRIRLVIIVISTVRNARARKRMRETREEKQRGGERKKEERYDEEKDEDRK